MRGMVYIASQTHVLIRWQIYPDWGDSRSSEHARLKSTPYEDEYKYGGRVTGYSHECTHEEIHSYKPVKRA